MNRYEQRRRLLERFKQAEAILRERETTYLACVRRHGAVPERELAYADVVAARQAAERIFADLQNCDLPPPL
ncbi:hypothetical protein BI364_01950 [Acidihalobacter yilgarnensis]|uniref:Uncharacterized protein n=1 Tax=Acidihalobacter yilgarnensis TaxID=2819280 RepID=A0A1D8IKG3_9GAMM|nr:hypothetical protein [Acidihalobacter yilgarnensis]AOU96934.1 hypothetical protein BI364_01950 [Acidihalobacter yilgarnensis]